MTRYQFHRLYPEEEKKRDIHLCGYIREPYINQVGQIKGKCVFVTRCIRPESNSRDCPIYLEHEKLWKTSKDLTDRI